MRVLIVDDSVVFRSQIRAAIDHVDGIQVVGAAPNGKIALERIAQDAVDVIVLDLEMPEMSGIEMLKIMRERHLTQSVIVFAASSGEGVQMAMHALRAGASDFVEKPKGIESLEQALDAVRKELVPKILQFKLKIDGQKSIPLAPKTKVAPDLVAVSERRSTPFNRLGYRTKAFAIGCSTGGPNALEKILSKLKGQPLSVPLFIAQHMPPHFTAFLATRIHELSGHPAQEAKHGDIVQPGHIYVAPGDFHMTVQRSLDSVIIYLDQGPKRNSVRPAVDNLFESLAKVYGDACVALVLTGMGEDGLVGAKAIKAAAGGIMIQDKNSSVVWGMPGAIHDANAFDLMGDLDECASVLLKMAS